MQRLNKNRERLALPRIRFHDDGMRSRGLGNFGGSITRDRESGQQRVEWPYYGSDVGAQRFSPTVQINRDNVSNLRVAWTYHTGDISDGAKGRSKTGFENTPIVVDGRMYISTPFCRVIALDPESGRGDLELPIRK